MHVPMRRRVGFSLMLVLACGDDGGSGEGTTGDTTGPGTTMTTNPSTSDASTGSSTTEAMTESAEESTMGGSVSTSLGEEGTTSSSTGSLEGDPSSGDDTTTGEDTTDTSGMTLVTDSTFGPGTESDTDPPPPTSSESGIITGGECAIGGTGGMGMCEWGIYCENFTHEMVCDLVECVCFEDGVETNACPAMDVCDDGSIEEYAEMCCGIGV
jgi:hypothetical protein